MALQRQPLQLPFECKSEMNELQTDITNSPDAPQRPQLITKSLNSLKLLKINIQIGGALLVELVRLSLINRLESGERAGLLAPRRHSPANK